MDHFLEFGRIAVERQKDFAGLCHGDVGNFHLAGIGLELQKQCRETVSIGIRKRHDDLLKILSRRHGIILRVAEHLVISAPAGIKSGILGGSYLQHQRIILGKLSIHGGIEADHSLKEHSHAFLFPLKHQNIFLLFE